MSSCVHDSLGCSTVLTCWCSDERLFAELNKRTKRSYTQKQVLDAARVGKLKSATKKDVEEARAETSKIVYQTVEALEHSIKISLRTLDVIKDALRTSMHAAT